MDLSFLSEAFSSKGPGPAAGVSKFFPSLVYPDAAWQPAELRIELVEGFDRGNTGYIA